MDKASYLIFYETWYALAEGRDTDAKRLAFYDTIFRYYFEGIEPQKPVRGESSGEAWASWDAFLVAKPVIDNRRKKIEAGRVGGLAGRGKSRNVGNQNACKTPDEATKEQDENNTKTKAKQKQIKSKTKANQKGALDINKNNNSSNINIPTGLLSKSLAFNSVYESALRAHTQEEQNKETDNEGQIKTNSDLPPVERPATVPTNEELEMMATQMKIPKDYIPVFTENMQRLGWGYVNRGGSFVALNRRNCKAILAGFWNNHQKNQQPKNTTTETIGVKIEATDDYENRF